jgi:cytochrome c biogenesis protein CcmG/thiol:disulfide interchange protein DsbE
MAMENATATPQALEQRPARRIWRYLALAAVVAFICLLLYGLLSKGTSDRIDQALNEGRAVAAPGFNLEVLEKGQLPPRLARGLGPAMADGKLSTSELKGTPFVLNLWASWCEPCRQEARPLQSAWQAAQRKGVLFQGLDIQDLRPDARAFLSEFGTTYPSVREADREVAKEYGATGIPETFFIDSRGNVVGHVIGAIDNKQIAAGVGAAATGEVAGVGEGGEQREK